MQLFISDKIKVADRCELNWAIYYHPDGLLQFVCSFIVCCALPPSLSHSPCHPYTLSSSLWLLSCFRLRLFGDICRGDRFVFFASFRNSCCSPRFVSFMWKWNEIVFASSEPRELSTENWELRKVDSAIAANGSRNPASQVYRQTDRQIWIWIWRSSRSPRWRTLNKTQIVPVQNKWKNARNKIKSANKTKQKRS